MVRPGGYVSFVIGQIPVHIKRQQRTCTNTAPPSGDAAMRRFVPHSSCLPVLLGHTHPESSSLLTVFFLSDSAWRFPFISSSTVLHELHYPIRLSASQSTRGWVIGIPSGTPIYTLTILPFVCPQHPSPLSRVSSRPTTEYTSCAVSNMALFAPLVGAFSVGLATLLFTFFTRLRHARMLFIKRRKMGLVRSGTILQSI